MDRFANRKKDAMGRVGATDNTLEFTPPEGMDTKGSSGTLEATWVKDANGKFRITALDGVSLTGGADNETSEPAPDDETAEGEGMTDGNT